MDDVLRLVSLPSLMIGVGIFLFVTFALIWGCRPMFFAGALMYSFACLGCALSTNYSSHLLGRIWLGIGAGCAEVLVPLTIADISFVSLCIS